MWDVGARSIATRYGDRNTQPPRRHYVKACRDRFCTAPKNSTRVLDEADQLPGLSLALEIHDPTPCSPSTSKSKPVPPERNL